MADGILGLCLNLSYCCQISPAGLFSCWQAANGYAEIKHNWLDMFGLFDFTTPSSRQQKQASKWRTWSFSLAEVLHLFAQCQQLVSLKLLFGTSVSQLLSYRFRKWHKLDTLWIQAVTHQQIPDPLSDMNHTRVSYRRVQTRCQAVVPVITLHVTGNERDTTRELEQRKTAK